MEEKIPVSFPEEVLVPLKDILIKVSGVGALTESLLLETLKNVDLVLKLNRELSKHTPSQMIIQSLTARIDSMIAVLETTKDVMDGLWDTFPELHPDAKSTQNVAEEEPTTSNSQAN